MKKLLMALMCVSFLASSSFAFADGKRFGVQFGSGMDFGGVYYGKDHLWAAGAKMGYNEMETTVEGVDFDADSLTYSIFARKNWKIKNNTYYGLGLSVAWQDGEISANLADKKLTLDVEEWSIAPYFIIDYRLNDDFIINAGAMIANFKYMETSFEGNHYSHTDTVEYMEPFLVLTYLF